LDIANKIIPRPAVLITAGFYMSRKQRKSIVYQKFLCYIEKNRAAVPQPKKGE